MASANLTAARLRELLHYDPLTGIFKRRISTSQNARAGDVAGSIEAAGYIRIAVDGKRYRAHRLAWLYMTGEWPALMVDHEDTNKQNNRWINLREATHSSNCQNIKRSHKDSSTGHLGVTFCVRRQLFIARIWDGKHNRYLGQYDDPEMAHQAYVEAKRKLHSGGTL